jgi:hypothetical protein
MLMILISLMLIASSVTSLTLPVADPQSKQKENSNLAKKQPPASTGYKTSEKIEKAPAEDHPCNLTRTSMKISFPELRHELFVNILGYREPNLVHLWQCRGYCGVAGSPVACMPVRMTQRTVTMMFKTNSSGRDSKERSQELILDEHVECGCQCHAGAASYCAGWFNNNTCECECDERRFGEERLACESQASTYWDSVVCACASKGVVPRGVEQVDWRGCGGRGQRTPQEGRKMFEAARYTTSWYPLVFVILGCFITVSIFLCLTTCYYRKKAARLKQPQNGSVKKPDHNHRGHNNEKEGMKTGRVPRSKSKHILIPKNPPETFSQLNNLSASSSANEPFQERYDEHGVMIENKMFQY